MKSCINLYYQLTVTDTKTGKILSKTRQRRSKSFVIAFLLFLHAHLACAYGQVTGTTSTIKDVANASKSLQIGTSLTGQWCPPKGKAPSGDAAYGIAVGTGTTPVDTLDYNLETKVAHGVGAGQLQYGASTMNTPLEVGANVDYVFTRSYVNGSGGTINITETGLLVTGKDAGLAQIYACIIHDVFALVAVANGQTLTVTYTVRTTV